MDHALRNAAVVAVAFGIGELVASTPEIGWAPDERSYRSEILNRKRIPGEVRLIQDRFARVCDEMRLSHEHRDELRGLIFSS